MSEAFGDPALASVSETRQEAYSFACLNCGHGWEQAYAIEHHADADGHIRYVYRANGVRVPSPLTRPSCPGCGGTHVRIMRAGRVAQVDTWWHAAPPAPAPLSEPEPATPLVAWHPHLPFHFHLRRRHTPPEA